LANENGSDARATPGKAAAISIYVYYTRLAILPTNWRYLEQNKGKVDNGREMATTIGCRSRGDWACSFADFAGEHLACVYAPRITR